MTPAPWDLPPDWRWSKFEEVASVASNLVDPAEYSAMPHVAPNHIESQTGRLLPTRTINEDGVTSAKHRFCEGQVLYSKIRPYLAKVALAPFDGLCSADMYPLDTAMEPRFLKWWMLTPTFTRLASQQQARTVLPKINKKALQELPVPVPSLAEQQRIAALLEDHLSRIEAATRGLGVATRRLATYEASALAACRDGEEMPLAEVTAIQGGIQKQQKRAPKDNAYAFLRVANVTANGLDLSEVHQVELFPGELDRLLLRAGDLLVVEGNGSPSQIGRAALWDGSIDDCVHQNHLIRVRALPGLLPAYLEAVWNSPQNRRKLTELSSSSNGLHTLSVSKLKTLRIPVPSIQRQDDLVRTMDAVREREGLLRAALVETTRRVDRLRQALLVAAFSGRLTGRRSDKKLVKELAGV